MTKQELVESYVAHRNSNQMLSVGWFWEYFLLERDQTKPMPSIQEFQFALQHKDMNAILNYLDQKLPLYRLYSPAKQLIALFPQA